MTISIFNCIQNTLSAFEADEIKKVFKIGDSKNNFYQHCSIVEKGIRVGNTVFNRIFTDACITRHIHGVLAIIINSATNIAVAEH